MKYQALFSLKKKKKIIYIYIIYISSTAVVIGALRVIVLVNAV